MKTLIAILMFCGLTVHAAQFGPYQGQQSVYNASGFTLNGGTNKALALTTNAFYVVDCSLSENIALFADFKYLNAVGAGDVNSIRMDIYRGIDATTFESNSWTSWVITAATTTTTSKSQMTNINVLGVPFLRFQLANVSTNSHATNITITAGSKI